MTLPEIPPDRRPYEEALDSEVRGLSEQVADLSQSTASVSDAQSARIDELEQRVAALEAGGPGPTPEPQQKILFGCSINYRTKGMTFDQEWARHVQYCGQPDMVRSFYNKEPDGVWKFGIGSARTPETKAPNSWASFKFAGATAPLPAAAITNSIKTYPDTGVHIVTFFHEPEDDVMNSAFTWAQWIDRQIEFANAVKAANKSSVLVAPVFMGRYHLSDTSPTSDKGNLANLVSAAKTAGKLDDLNNVWDLVGFDQYNKASDNGVVPDAQHMTVEYYFDDFMNWVATNFPGKQVGLAETGFCGGPNNLDAKRTWLTRVHDYAYAKRWKACLYYDAMTSATSFEWYLTWVGDTAVNDPQTASLWGSWYG